MQPAEERAPAVSYQSSRVRLARVWRASRVGFSLTSTPDCDRLKPVVLSIPAGLTGCVALPRVRGTRSPHRTGARLTAVAFGLTGSSPAARGDRTPYARAELECRRAVRSAVVGRSNGDQVAEAIAGTASWTILTRALSDLSKHGSHAWRRCRATGCLELPKAETTECRRVHQRAVPGEGPPSR